MRLRPFLRRFRSDFLGWLRFTAVTVVVTGLVAGAAWGAYAEVWPAMVAHSYFRLRSVKVSCDSAAAEPASLAAHAGLYDGTSLWEIDPRHARSALASVPWVRDARIFRRFPDQVAVEVFRREAVAATVGEQGPFLIDAHGVVYREGEEVPHADLPYLTGWSAAVAHADRAARLRTSMRVLEAVQAVGIAVSEVHVDEAGTFRVYPDARRVVVTLGREPDPDALAERLAAVWSAVPDSEDLREIDLSYADRAVVRTAAGRAKAVIAAMAGTPSGEDTRSAPAGGGAGNAPAKSEVGGGA
jgi:cell division septal protein FtsQ